MNSVNAQLINKGYDVALLIAKIESELSSVEYLQEVDREMSCDDPKRLSVALTANKHALNTIQHLASIVDEFKETEVLEDDSFSPSGMLRHSLNILLGRLKTINEQETT